MANVAPGQASVIDSEPDAWAELKTKLQADVYKQSIRLQDFLAPFDRHRRGSVIEPNFERAVAAAGIKLTDQDMKVIRDQFGIVEKSQPLIRYHHFMDSINSVFGPLNLEQHPNQAIIDVQKLTANYEQKIALSLRQSDKLLPQEISILKQCMQRIRDRIVKLRFDASLRYRDFDKFNSGWLEMYLRVFCIFSTVAGSVSKVQFHKCLTAAGFNFKDETINLLSRQYASGRHVDHVDYRKFLRDIIQDATTADSSVSMNRHRKMSYIKQEPQVPVTMDNILAKMRKATSGYSIRFFDYLRDADPLRKNAISQSRLAAVLSSIGDINLKDDETALIQRMFPHEKELGQINYQNMADSILVRMLQDLNVPEDVS